MPRVPNPDGCACLMVIDGKRMNMDLEDRMYIKDTGDDDVNSPYRTNMNVQAKKLPRRRAYIRGLWRRIALPTMIVGMASSLWTCQNVLWTSKNFNDAETQKLLADKHFGDWQASIDANQRFLDARKAAMDDKDRDLTTREHIFQDFLKLCASDRWNAENSALAKELSRGDKK